MRRAIAFVLLAVLVADGLAFLPGARAVNPAVTFATTAAFDAGNKTASGGNYGVETVTDNLGARANAFELGNFKSDTFDLAAPTGTTLKWTNSSKGTAAIVCSAFIAGGVYNVTLSTNNGGKDCGGVSTATVSGSLDIRFKIKRNNDVANNQAQFCLLNQTVICGSAGGVFGTSSGLWLRLSQDIAGAQWNLQFFTITLGTATLIGSNTNLQSTCPVHVFCWLRVVRTGTAVSDSYSTNGVSFTADKSTTFATATSLYISFTGSKSGASPAWFEFDDYYLFSGKVDSGGYRTSSNWRSPVQNTAGTPTSLLLNYGNVSSQNMISRLALVSSSGILFWSVVVNINSGTIFNVFIDAPPSFLSRNWTVEVDLVGNGTASPFVSSVSVTLSVVATISLFQASDLVFIVFLILMFGLGLAGFALDFPVLTIIGGIAGFMFGWWLFLQTNNVILAILMWGVGSVFMLVGVMMALMYEGGTSA